MRVLLTEDDKTIAAGLAYSLTEEGYEPVVCGSVRETREALAAGGEFGLCLLDLSLPDGSGFELCREIKARGDTPVIFLTAYDDEGSVVMGLDMGADDYIAKPFRIRELMSRIRSVLRRYGRTGESDRAVLQIGNVKVHTLEAKVYRGGEEVQLTSLEYRLLLVFFQNPGQILTRGRLLEGIWDVGGNFVSDNTLTVYIKRLREKLEDDPQNPTLIETVRGLGYRTGKPDSRED